MLHHSTRKFTCPKALRNAAMQPAEIVVSIQALYSPNTRSGGLQSTTSSSAMNRKTPHPLTRRTPAEFRYQEHRRSQPNTRKRRSHISIPPNTVRLSRTARINADGSDPAPTTHRPLNRSVWPHTTQVILAGASVPSVELQPAQYATKFRPADAASPHVARPW